MNYNETKKKFNAAKDLLSGSSTTSTKVRAALALLKGLHPDIDTKLAMCDEHLAAIEKLEGGSLIELSAEALPEETEEQKKRKRLLLLFIRSWDDLKSEVARVEKEFDNAKNNNGGQGSGGMPMWKRILSAAKGPLAIVTVVAIAIAALQVSAVDVTIKNDGCGTLQVSSSIPISLRGLSLPSGPIANGGSANASLPPLAVSVDGTKLGVIAMSAFGMHLSFNLPGVSDVQLDGASLMGKKTEVKLGDKPAHELRLVCK